MGRFWERFRGRNRKAVIAGTVAGCVCILAGGYAGVGYYYSGRFYIGTFINGVSCSNKTAEEAERGLMNNLLNYKLTIRGRGGIEGQITGNQLALSYIDMSQAEEVLWDQKPWAWIFAMMGDRNYHIAFPVDYNEGILDSLLEGMPFMDGKLVTPPADAAIEETDSGFVIRPEEQGNMVRFERLKEAAAAAIGHGETVLDLDKEGLYEAPSVLGSDEQLQSEVRQLNELTRARITYDFTDRQKVVNRGIIRQMLSKDLYGNYFLDKDKAAEWVKQMAYDTDTFGLPRDFTAHDGSTIRLEGGDYGWCIDREKTTEELISAVSAGMNGSLQPSYVYTAMDRSADDIGGTYVEVCISQQRMWFYKDGVELVDTPVVTGDPNKGNATPAGGVWAIDAKINGQILRGQDYAQPVAYWLPFNGNVGIHDASHFRSYFGGDIYLTNGSHGCINTPTDQAEIIFRNVDKGYPVVVYE